MAWRLARPGVCTRKPTRRKKAGLKYSIAPEHLLLGLLQEGEGIAVGVLERGFGAKRDQIRSQIYQALSNSGQWAEQTTLKDVALAKTSVVTCRIIGSDLDAIDTLIEAGIRSTRSEAAAWLIHAGIEANKELLEQVYGTVAEIRRLRLVRKTLSNKVPRPNRRKHRNHPKRILLRYSSCQINSAKFSMPGSNGAMRHLSQALKILCCLLHPSQQQN